MHPLVNRWSAEAADEADEADEAEEAEEAEGRQLPGSNDPQTTNLAHFPATQT